MSGYEAPCPSCGAPIAFSLGASLLKVCEHCGVAVVRKGVDLKAYGKVAELIPTPSVLALDATGGYEGAPPFTLVGRLQLDYGAGTWDEWLMAFRNDTWAWLSESQGKFHYMGQAALPPVPAFSDLRPGQTVDLGPPGTFVIIEVREARFMSAAGELPFDVEPGSLLRYADLSGPGGQFGTLDYGTGDQAEALYVGREVALGDLGLKGLPDLEERRAKAAGQSLSCPQCGGPLEIRAPDQTQRIACPYCGSLLDATKDLAVLEALARVPVEPKIPLGSKGRFGGVEWTLIGFMERSVTVEGVRYPWQEYLLYEPRSGFRWLVEAKGHWSFVEPVNAGDVTEALGGRVRYRDLTFKHFQGGTARVDHVLGEFYWAVARGDETETADYVSPPHMLSRESGGGEVNWSFGTYTKGEDVWKAFGLQGRPPAAEGVGPHQPAPSGASRHVFARALLFLGILFALYLGLTLAGGRTVDHETVEIPQSAVSGAPESAHFSDRFFVLDEGNVEVQVKAPVSNSWLYLDGALIDEETGAVDEFDVEVSYYFGRDSDGSWSEGGQRAHAYIADVPPGRYVLRLAPQWEAGHRPPASYDLTVRSRVPRFYQALLAALALGAWPLLVGWRQFRFEMQRWSDSDHPWVTTSSGGDDE
jgi:DNA-directed RNA polymerase subunit RPC12/RpoP